MLNASGPAQDAPPAGDAAHCRRAMRSVLEAQIIPRLLAAHGLGHGKQGAQGAQGAAGQGAAAAEQPSTLAVGAAHAGIGPADIETLARACAGADAERARAQVAAFRAQGLPTEALFLALIGPAARWLGAAWEDDRLGFSDVTVGLTLLHELVQDLAGEPAPGPPPAGERRILLACAPGSQHVLGLAIVAELFAREGWTVVLEPGATAQDLCAALQADAFDVLGLSVALDSPLAAIGRRIGRLREASRNPRCAVLLGGPVFARRPLAPEAVGADAISADAHACIRVAAALVAERAAQR